MDIKAMSHLNRLGWLAAALLVSIAGHAGSNVSDIEISNAWTRATAPGQEAAAVDLTITSKQAVTLIGVSSPVATAAELHSMTTEGGMMKMREVKSIALPANMRVNLKESGYHLMLSGLKVSLKEDETVPLILSFKEGKQGVVKIEIKAEVRSLHATKVPSQEEDHQHMHIN
jgi:copper(I)-binding protein